MTSYSGGPKNIGAVSHDTRARDSGHMVDVLGKYAEKAVEQGFREVPIPGVAIGVTEKSIMNPSFLKKSMWTERSPSRNSVRNICEALCRTASPLPISARAADGCGECGQVRPSARGCKPRADLR